MQSLMSLRQAGLCGQQHWIKVCSGKEATTPSARAGVGLCPTCCEDIAYATFSRHPALPLPLPATREKSSVASLTSPSSKPLPGPFQVDIYPPMTILLFGQKMYANNFYYNVNNIRYNTNNYSPTILKLLYKNLNKQFFVLSKQSYWSESSGQNGLLQWPSSGLDLSVHRGLK